MRLGLASLLVALLLFIRRPPAVVAVSSPIPENDDVSLISPSLSQAPSPTSDQSFSSTAASDSQPYGFKSHLFSNHLDDDKWRVPDEEDWFNATYDGYLNATDVLDFKDNLTVGDLKKEVPKKKELTVGYLTAVKGTVKERQGLQISGAITMALDEINKDPSILPNVTLKLKWHDTIGETVVATKAMTDMICEGVSAFFWP
ncbi:hypothetical protein NQ317_000869 [Molorchus minor]|uniref:Receptor ligand binding region domain-containing protein n=1 Tax=Molorchus minor TaxID=1323400 RepID=A0ABQ9JUX1_9CUCU|nr:hypothetical protein NQ317_000869 [Molorchus minor]